MRPSFLFNVPGAKHALDQNSNMITLKQLESIEKKPKEVEVFYCKNDRDRRSLGLIPTHLALLKFG